jgi:hypothetical protein
MLPLKALAVAAKKAAKASEAGSDSHGLVDRCHRT